MSASKFGQMLVIIGIAIFLGMFFLTDWSDQWSFMKNIRYAELLCLEYSYTCESKIRLGQGLILPLVLISLGLMINSSIVSDKLLHKLVPFVHLSEADDIKQDNGK